MRLYCSDNGSSQPFVEWQTDNAAVGRCEYKIKTNVKFMGEGDERLWWIALLIEMPNFDYFWFFFFNDASLITFHSCLCIVHSLSLMTTKQFKWFPVWNCCLLLCSFGCWCCAEQRMLWQEAKQCEWMVHINSILTRRQLNWMNHQNNRCWLLTHHQRRVTKLHIKHIRNHG